MKGIIARYYYGGDFEKAFDLLHSSKKSNPYIMFNQSLIGKIHNYLGFKMVLFIITRLPLQDFPIMVNILLNYLSHTCKKMISKV